LPTGGRFELEPKGERSWSRPFFKLRTLCSQSPTASSTSSVNHRTIRTRYGSSRSGRARKPMTRPRIIRPSESSSEKLYRCWMGSHRVNGGSYAEERESASESTTVASVTPFSGSLWWQSSRHADGLSTLFRLGLVSRIPRRSRSRHRSHIGEGASRILGVRPPRLYHHPFRILKEPRLHGVSA
jgi:hypothetical protein